MAGKFWLFQIGVWNESVKPTEPSGIGSLPSNVLGLGHRKIKVGDPAEDNINILDSIEEPAANVMGNSRTVLDFDLIQAKAIQGSSVFE